MEQLKLDDGIFLHTHPKMEEYYGIPDSHVIIDADAYEWLFNFHCGFKKVMKDLKKEVENYG